jgi:hypothetical protein
VLSIGEDRKRCKLAAMKLEERKRKRAEEGQAPPTKRKKKRRRMRRPLPRLKAPTSEFALDTSLYVIGRCVRERNVRFVRALRRCPTPLHPSLPPPSPPSTHSRTVSDADIEAMEKEEMEAEADAPAAPVPVPPGAKAVAAGPPAMQHAEARGAGPILSVPTVPKATSITPQGKCVDVCASRTKRLRAPLDAAAPGHVRHARQPIAMPYPCRRLVL